METVLIPLLMGAFLVVPIGAVAALVAWSRHVQRRRDAAWSALAQKLGLGHGRNTLHGQLDGQAVRAYLEARGGKNKTYYTVVAALVSPQLDLGLAVSRQGLIDNALAALFGNTELEIGDPAFDQSFRIRADEPARARALLGPQLRAMLMQLLASNCRYRLTDAGFHIERMGATEDTAWLEWALRSAAAVSGHLDRARGAVPVASALTRHRDAWRTYAQAAGLRGTDTPLCMWGVLDGNRVTAYAIRRGANNYGLEVLVSFAQPLGIGLLVRPAGAMDAVVALFGGQDDKVGDPGFDTQFVIKTSRSDRLGRILNPAVRRRILELHESLGQITVRDDGVTISRPGMTPDPSDVPRLVGQIKTLATQIATNASAPDTESIGPYR